MTREEANKILGFNYNLPIDSNGQVNINAFNKIKAQIQKNKDAIERNRL